MKKKVLIASLCAMLLVTGCGQKAKLKDGFLEPSFILYYSKI